MVRFNLENPILQWEFVRGVANNDLTRVVGFVPLIGYLILFNDKIAEIVSFNAIAGIESSTYSPFLMSGLLKLRLSFFGSLSLLISYVIYKVYHPRILDDARGRVDFSSQVMNIYSVGEVQEMEAQVHSDRWTRRLEMFWIFLGKPRPKKAILAGFRPDVRRFMFEEHGDYIHLLSLEWWTGMMHKSRLARISAIGFAAIGYTLIALPSFDIAQAVLRDALSLP